MFCDYQGSIVPMIYLSYKNKRVVPYDATKNFLSFLNDPSRKGDISFYVLTSKSIIFFYR
jgi:hypothetical protein